MEDAARRAVDHDDAGFTLVEVVMAMLVLTVAVLALVHVQTRALAGVVAAEQRQQAAGFANSALERVRATTATSAGFDSVVKGRAPASGEGYTSDEALVTPNGTTPPDKALQTRTCSEQSGCVLPPDTVTGTPFTTTLYVSQPSPAVAGLYTVTAVTSWTSTVSGASTSHRVVLRTRVSAPGAS